MIMCFHFNQQKKINTFRIIVGRLVFALDISWANLSIFVKGLSKAITDNFSSLCAYNKDVTAPYIV